MNYQKLDAALSAALHEVENRDAPNFQVFIHTQSLADAEAKLKLEQFGIKVGEGKATIATAALSARAIANLSQQPWVKAIRLSQLLAPSSDRRQIGVTPPIQLRRF